MIQIDDQQYWLYAAFDPESNESLHTKLETTRTNALAEMFFGELREKYDVEDAVSLDDDATPLKEACTDTASISDTNVMEIVTV